MRSPEAGDLARMSFSEVSLGCETQIYILLWCYRERLSLYKPQLTLLASLTLSLVNDLGSGFLQYFQKELNCVRTLDWLQVSGFYSFTPYCVL